MAKSTDAEILLRVSTVVEMLMKGQERQDIIQYCAKKWNINERQADVYIKKAKERIKRNKDADLDYHISLSIMRYQDLYKRNFNIQDYRECRQVQGDLAKLLGIEAAQKINVSGELSINQITGTKVV